MLEADALTIVGLTFLLAGLVKGVIGLGLPTISLAVLTVSFGLWWRILRHQCLVGGNGGVVIPAVLGMILG